MENEIVLLPPKESAVAIFSSNNGLDPYLAKIREEIDAFIPDASTKKGRDAIASIAYKVAKSKTALDNLGKELVAELKDVPKRIDAERKRMRDTLDAWKDEVRKPLTDFELAEKARIERHKNEINLIINWRQTEWANSDQVARVMADLSELDTGERFEEFELQATNELKETLSYLISTRDNLEKHEKDMEELERLRKEAAEKEQKEREQQIAREAAENAAAAERNRLIAEQERKDREARDAIDKANRDRLEAENARLKQEQNARDAAIRAEQEKHMAIENERKRIEQERLSQIAEAEQREKNKAHARAINNEAMRGFIDAGLSEDCAKKAVTAIAKGLIKNVKINY